MDVLGIKSTFVMDKALFIIVQLLSAASFGFYAYYSRIIWIKLHRLYVMELMDDDPQIKHYIGLYKGLFKKYWISAVVMFGFLLFWAYLGHQKGLI